MDVYIVNNSADISQDISHKEKPPYIVFYLSLVFLILNTVDRSIPFLRYYKTNSQ